MKGKGYSLIITNYYKSYIIIQNLENFKCHD